ncbi:teichuronic acid biosynthesis protein TuaH [Niallia taxi]|uniref:teichuronic acid biosynthesis protein TuaH n=1 Tax=Niallia taxi TaxID=2499688 RepID=UPI0015F461BA|nr:glycosyltransferase [Niallia taxi]
MKSIHVLVATGEWENDQLRYRRHRLAEYLQKQEDTHEVIWLCPGKSLDNNAEKLLENGVRQWKIADLGESKLLRFSRFISIFYKNKLASLIAYLRDKKDMYEIKLWYTYPAFPNLANMFPWNKIIYDCSDLWAESINGSKSAVSMLKHKIIHNGESTIINKANIITCTSVFLEEQVKERLQGSSREKVYTYENGVDFSLFQHKEKADHVIGKGNGPVLGYIGGIKPKLDFSLIQATAERRPDWQFLFVGPDGTNGNEEFQRLLKLPNVTWTGSVPPPLVSHYMNLIDIGIMPYKPSIYNKAIFPLKLFEFLAAGKAAIGTNLPSTEGYAEKGVYICLEGSDTDSFILACEEMRTNKAVKNIEERRISLAKTKDWNSIFAQMTKL